MRQRIRCGFVLLTVSLLLGTMGCSTPDDGKVPVTASSDKALEYYLKARQLQDNLRFQESLEYLRQAVSLDPEFALAHLALASAEPTVQGFFDRLKKATALVDDVSEGERLMILGFEAGVNADPMQQRDYYQQLVAAYPDDERAHNLLGNHYFGLQEYSHAIESYDQAITLEPTYPQPYNQLGYAHRFLGNYEDAEQAFKRYIELIPNDPNPYDSYAELLLKMGRFEEAIESYRKALNADDLFVASHVGIATCFNMVNRHQEARDQLSVLDQRARNEADTRAASFATAVSYIDEGEFDQALKVLHERYAKAEAGEDTPAMAADLGLIGLVLLEQDKPDEALEYYERSIGIMRESGLSQEVIDAAELGHFYAVARVAVERGDFETAKSNADQHRTRTEAMENPTQIRQSHEIAGIIALAEGEFDTAISELEQANQQNPYNLYRIALAYHGKGDTEQAKAWCERTATFNALNNLNYAFIRKRAAEMLETV
jgi:tetratricopeptide (TPR) repeat protein